VFVIGEYHYYMQVYVHLFSTISGSEEDEGSIEVEGEDVSDEDLFAGDTWQTMYRIPGTDGRVVDYRSS